MLSDGNEIYETWVALMKSQKFKTRVRANSIYLKKRMKCSSQQVCIQFIEKVFSFFPLAFRVWKFWFDLTWESYSIKGTEDSKAFPIKLESHENILRVFKLNRECDNLNYAIKTMKNFMKILLKMGKNPLYVIIIEIPKVLFE